MAIASWLADFKVLRADGIHQFAKSIIENGDLKNDILKLLKHEQKPEKFDPVIHQLFSFYRLDNEILQRFMLEFLPSILYNYFISICSPDQKNSASIEALLLGIYNIDAAKSQEDYLIDKTPPSSLLSVASVFHNPMHTDVPTQLTKITLDKLHIKANINCHKLLHVDSINNRNRLIIVSHSLMRYNQDIAYYSKLSHQDICELCSLFIKPTMKMQETTTNANNNSSPWLPVDENLISQLLQAVFFIMYNDLTDKGYVALESLYFRAIYDLLPHSILAISAVHSLMKSRDKNIEGDITLRSLLTLSNITHPTVANNKDAITAASFKPHILPEDIEVKDVGKESSTFTSATHQLFGGGVTLAGGEEPSLKMRQKSVISKVFHISAVKRKDEFEKKEDEKFITPVCLSPPPQSGSGIQFSMAKKALKNPFKSEQQTASTSSASLARQEFLNKRDTISIAPYFSQLDGSETTPTLPSASKMEKKHKSKGSKLRRKHLKRAPSSSSSSSPKHSLSVSSYLSKDVIPERNEVTKSDVDDDEEEEEDEQVECQDENDEFMNESDSIVDTRNKMVGNDILNFQNQVGKRQLLLRHITFAANLKENDHGRPGALNRCDSERISGMDEIKEDVIVPLLERKDSIPRLAILVDRTKETDKDDACKDEFDIDGDSKEQQSADESVRLMCDS